MSIQSEINRLKQAVSDAFTAIGNKGGTVPSSKVSGNLATAINSIPEGVELNFEVVGGTSQPSNPKENTIWVNTNTAITDWVFSATQPTAATGRVWIPIGTESVVEFNALKKNSVMVYPLSAKQCVGGAWVDKTAKSYQNGEWVDWWNGELFDNGNQWERITGGWTSDGYAYTDRSRTRETPVIGDTIRCATVSGSSTYSICGTKNLVDLKDVSFIKCHATDAVTSFLAVYSAKKYNTIDVLTRASIVANGVTTLDVSKWDSGYVIIHVHSGGEVRKANVSKVWME